MLENIHRVCFVVPALDEAAECTGLEKNKHKFGISKLDAPHIFRESAEEVVRSNAPNSQAAERVTK